LKNNVVEIEKLRHSKNLFHENFKEEKINFKKDTRTLQDFTEELKKKSKIKAELKQKIRE